MDQQIRSSRQTINGDLEETSISNATSFSGGLCCKWHPRTKIKAGKGAFIKRIILEYKKKNGLHKGGCVVGCKWGVWNVCAKAIEGYTRGWGISVWTR